MNNDQGIKYFENIKCMNVGLGSTRSNPCGLWHEKDWDSLTYYIKI